MYICLASLYYDVRQGAPALAETWMARRITAICWRAWK
jgi:hypothetical protein